MKKVIITLISCLVLAYLPTTSYAEKKIYIENQTGSDPSGPRRDSGTSIVTIGVDEENCELYVTCNDSLSGLHVTLTANGITYEEDMLNAVMGQTLTYYLDSYNSGIYELTIEVGGDTIAAFNVTIMDD